MDKPILMNSFDEYIDCIKKQCSKYGREALRPRSYSDLKLWQFVVGFESPEGWYGIKLKKLKKLAFTNKEILEKYQTKLSEALQAT